MIRDILHHVSLLIIESSDKKEFLIGVYDNTYPLEVFRKRVNLIGGNQHPEDQSPSEILEREIREEFCIHTTEEKNIEEAIERTSGPGAGAHIPSNYASLEDIEKIRDAIITLYKPYADFLINVPYLKNKPPETSAIYSVYTADLPREIFECAKNNLNNGKSIKSEGFAMIISLEDLKNGKPLSAGATPFVLSNYLKTEIPDPYGLHGVFLGKPRATLRDYESEFRCTNVLRRQ